MGVNNSKTASTERRYRRIVQNYLIIWLDANTDKNNNDYKNTMTQLHQIFTTVNTFTKADEFIEFIKPIENKKIFVISSGSLGETTVPIIYDLPQINGIFIFCANKPRHDQWAQNHAKVKGVFTGMQPISEALKKAVQQCEQNTISMSFVSANDDGTEKDLNELDQSFMYTQILKEILLTIDFRQKHLTELVNYCREEFKDNPGELKKVDKLHKEYTRHSAIWWYTYQCFIFSVLNCALCTMEIDIIIKLGFFLRALHSQIVKLHTEQYVKRRQIDSFVVYRGQELPNTEFERLQRSKGGLLSFNNFLSTSKNRNVSLKFVNPSQLSSDSVGILFIMKIDPQIKSTPFADVSAESFFKKEKEVLFSMHSIFRIGEIKQIDDNNRLWQVDLTLTADNDTQLHTLTEYIRGLTFPKNEGWDRLGKLLLHLGQYEGAFHVYDALLCQATSDSNKGYIYNQLGMIYQIQAKPEEAAECFRKALQCYERTFDQHQSDLASWFRTLGSVHISMGEYSKALSSYEAALAADENTPANDSLLAISYTNIGNVYQNMGEYSKALSYFDKALEFKQKTVPPDHLSLASSHINIGDIYDKMRDYSNALIHFESALKIQQKTLPRNHPDLAIRYANIALVCSHMNEHSKALAYFENAMKIKQKVLPSNHPSYVNLYNDIGLTYTHMKEYTRKHFHIMKKHLTLIKNSVVRSS